MEHNHIDTSKLSLPQITKYLNTAIAPRPIALVSSVNKEGIPNLSPFSFFNVFSLSPPILAFSTVKRPGSLPDKDTLANVKEIPELVVNLVNYDILEQTVLSSNNYPPKINEFKKAGLTAMPSKKVRPAYLAESPVAYECFVKNIIPFGDQIGSGNLIICEVVFIHLDKQTLDADENIDTKKLDLVARLGGPWYMRINESSFFQSSTKPAEKLAIGFDELPQHLTKSPWLSKKTLAILASVHRLPYAEEIENFFYENPDQPKDLKEKHKQAEEKIKKGVDPFSVLLFLLKE